MLWDKLKDHLDLLEPLEYLREVLFLCNSHNSNQDLSKYKDQYTMGMTHKPNVR